MGKQKQPQYRINLRPYRILYWPFLLPVALLLALFNIVSPVPFKIYSIIVVRVGQMASNQEEFFCKLDLGYFPKEFRVFIHRDRPSNTALLNVLKRYMRINQLFLPLFDVCHKLGGLGVSSTYLADMGGEDIEQTAAKTEQHVDLTASETSVAKKQMEAMNLNPDKPFVPVLSRDPAYLKSIKEPTDNSSYRNTDINTFIPAMEYLADSYQVIRVGSVVSSELKTNHPGIFDYSLSGKRTELLDVYLSAKCHFFLSCGTGLDAITSTLFRKPVLYVCLTPPGAVFQFKPWSMFIPKKYYNTKENRYLTLSELLSTGMAYCDTATKLDPYDVVVHDNSPDEILEATKEMAARLDGTWQETDEMKSRQERFWAHYKKHAPHYNYTTRISDYFLVKNPCWLD